ncbi:MAG: DNA repair protein RadC [Desulfatibacillum sp.]|nr:DNA repair protein RadC [Desulfatibacillum sp.]
MAEWTQNAPEAQSVNEAVRPIQVVHPGEGHRGRLRDRFLQNGLEGFLDYEVVELLLTLGTPRRDCKQQAKAAIRHFGSLKAVLAASRDELGKIKGLGPANIFGILLMRAVAEKFLAPLKDTSIDPGINATISSTSELFRFLRFKFEYTTKEYFFIVYLDVQNRILAMETPFEGSLNASQVYTRELIDKAIQVQASAVLLAHNHPSGSTEPSANDIQLTYTIYTAFRSVDIFLLEHIIIGTDGGYFSFADKGYFERFNREYDASRRKWI